MKPTYKVIDMSDYSYLERTDLDGKIWSIPMVEGNSDYQAYLAYVANGNKVPSNSSTPQAGA